MTEAYQKDEKQGRRRFLKYAGAAIVAVAAAVVGYYAYTQYGPKRTEGMPKREYIISLVNEAANLIEEKGEEFFPELRQKGSKWSHGEYYVFVWRIDGIRVVYPPDPSGEGEDMNDLKDPDGKPIGRLIIDIAKSEKGEGWIDYRWPKPGETEPSKKYTFIKRAKSSYQTYLVGSGYYE